jgi:hypothetical protein
MALQLIPGQLERFVGTFYRINAKKPPARPDVHVDGALERLVIAKGTMQIHINGQTVDVNIPPEDQVDDETYNGMLQLLTNQLVELLQVPQYTHDIMQAMQKGGLIAHFQGMTLRMNPLTPGMGDLDQF